MFTQRIFASEKSIVDPQELLYTLGFLPPILTLHVADFMQFMDAD